MSKAASSRTDRSSQSESPPLPPLILHVGVIGHRLDPEKRPTPDIPAMRRLVADILSRIWEAFEGLAAAESGHFSLDRSDEQNTRVIRIISSLAEGADQWVAEEALKLGYELQVPIPFALTEYEKDFGPPALAEFHRLKAQATAIFEMDGCRTREHESYEAAGRLVIGQSDLLVALWDGSDEMGRGGTGQMVRESLKNGVPVIWIKWASPEQWQLLDTPQWHLLQDLNPNEADTVATIDVYDRKGKLIRTKTEPIGAKQRVSKLVTQYFPDLEGEEIGSGYVRVTVGKGVASFALFGTRDLSVLAAIPPQVAP